MSGSPTKPAMHVILEMEMDADVTHVEVLLSVPA